MPELPDVEIYRGEVERGGLGREIEGTSLDDERMLDGLSSSTLRRALNGRKLSAARRLGKHLFVEIADDDRWLHLHFGMTGRVVVREKDEEEPPHTRLRIDFADGGHLAFTSQRRLGKIGLAESPERFAEERGLGPDPWTGDMDREGFRSRLAERRGSVKAALMNQKALAGLGNVYVDEILFQAEIHPETPVEKLDDDALDLLHRTVKRVLGTAIERGADPGRMPDGWLLSRREEGRPCPRCDGRIVKSQVSGRATYRCDTHQDEGAP